MAKKPRLFSAETKLSIVKRMLAGEEVKALAYTGDKAGAKKQFATAAGLELTNEEHLK
ncbi:MAG TPA: hypothetical protein VGK90_09685 [Rhizomicrobium sp.]|jgi:hypothetical protein